MKEKPGLPPGFSLCKVFYLAVAQSGRSLLIKTLSLIPIGFSYLKVQGYKSNCIHSLTPPLQQLLLPSCGHYA